MGQHKVKLDASTNQKARQTTFVVRAEHKKDLEKAKKALLAMLAPSVCIAVYIAFYFNDTRRLSSCVCFVCRSPSF